MFKKIAVLCVMTILLFVPSIYAANSIVVTGHTITISSIDEAWSSATDTTNLTTDQNLYGLYVHSIEFHPAATDDELIVYSGKSTSGSLTFHPVCADKYDERVKYYPSDVRRHLYLDYTNGTYTAGSVIIIELWKYE